MADRRVTVKLRASSRQYRWQLWWLRLRLTLLDWLRRRLLP